MNIMCVFSMFATPHKKPVDARKQRATSRNTKTHRKALVSNPRGLQALFCRYVLVTKNDYRGMCDNDKLMQLQARYLGGDFSAWAELWCLSYAVARRFVVHDWQELHSCTDKTIGDRGRKNILTSNVYQQAPFFACACKMKN